MPEDPRARNVRLMRDYLNRELIAGRDFLEAKLANLFPGLLGKLVNPIAKALYHAIGEAEVRKRVNEQLDVIAAAAKDAETVGLDAAIATWTPRSLETEEVVHRGDRKHPRFPDVEKLLARGFAERVRAIAPLLAHAGDVASYEDLSRAVYADRATPERVVAGQIAIAREVTAIVKANPKLLHFPSALQRHLFPLVDDVTAWYEKRFQGEFDRIYGAR